MNKAKTPAKKKVSKVWRPTKYNAQMPSKVRKYVASCVDVIQDYVTSKGKDSTGYKRIVAANIPTYEWLSKYIGVTVSTLHLRRTKHR